MKNIWPHKVFTCPKNEKGYLFVLKRYMFIIYFLDFGLQIWETFLSWSFKILAQNWLLPEPGNLASTHVAPCKICTKSSPQYLLKPDFTCPRQSGKCSSSTMSGCICKICEKKSCYSKICSTHSRESYLHLCPLPGGRRGWGQRSWGQTSWGPFWPPRRPEWTERCWLTCPWGPGWGSLAPSGDRGIKRWSLKSSIWTWVLKCIIKRVQECN